MPPSGTRLLPPRALRRQSSALNRAASTAQMTGPSHASIVAAQGSSGRCRVISASGTSPSAAAARPPSPHTAPRAVIVGQFACGCRPAVDKSPLLADLIGAQQGLTGVARDVDQRVVLRVVEPHGAHVEPHTAQLRRMRRSRRGHRRGPRPPAPPPAGPPSRHSRAPRPSPAPAGADDDNVACPVKQPPIRQPTNSGSEPAGRRCVTASSGDDAIDLLPATAAPDHHSPSSASR